MNRGRPESRHSVSSLRKRGKVAAMPDFPASWTWRRRPAAALAFLWAFLLVWGQVWAGDLEGKFLIATSRMNDPRFIQAVILVIQQDENGALGLIVNRPVYSVKLSELLREASLPSPELDPDVPVYFGGPVQISAGFLLHSPETRLDSTREILNGVVMSVDPEMLRRIGQADGPRRALMALGYAGWGPGQLDREIDEGAWLTIEAEADLVFAGDPQKTWRTLTDRIVVRF